MRTTWANWLGALALLGACNDAVPDDRPMGFDAGENEDAGAGDAGDGEKDAGDETDAGGDAEAQDAGDGGGADAGDGGDAATPKPEGCIERPEFDAPKGYPTFAVQNSDYSSASISLLDEEGNVLDESYLNGGSMLDGLPEGLHDDVALPTTPAEPKVLTSVARFHGDYVLRIDLGNGEVINRVRTQSDPFDMDDPTAAYSSNPQDYLYVDPTTAFVSRLQPNLDPDADDLDLGDDLLVIDPKSGKRLRSISLDAWVDTLEVENDEGETREETVYARPGSLVGLGCHAVFGTARQTVGYDGHPEGAVGVLDVPDEEVEMHLLDGLSNCGVVQPVSGDDTRALVECAGSPWGDPENAGLALVHVDADGALEVEHVYKREREDDPVLAASAVSLGGTRLVAKQTGDYAAKTPDTLYALDIASGEYSEIFEGEAPGDIGVGAYDPAREVLYVPDASAGVRVFQVDGEDFEEEDTIELDDALPPRTVRALRSL